MSKRVELLAPAGSYESMRAAFNVGADAVYIGGRQFGARAYADNTTDEELLSAIDYAHLYGKHLYLTVNTLVKDGELENLVQWLKPLYEAGLDAAIVQDMGVFSVIRREFPHLDIHASTQMTVTGPDGARLLKELGATRVVPARELCVGELKELYDATGMEVEAFVHGALCYGYSGQCLLSSLIGGRSGNRGRCAQACRLPYTALSDGKVLNRKDEPYLISLKDLCGLDMLPAMLDAGVYSLKIEGRMKSPLYTAGVTEVYRKYVDRYLQYGSEGYRVDDEDRRILSALFDRGGTTDGYLREKTGRQMLTLKEKPDRKVVDEQLFSRIERDYLGEAGPLPVIGRAEFLLGQNARLTVKNSAGIEVTVVGAVVEPAQKQPVTAESAGKQLKKTGGSGYVWEKLEIVTDGQGFLPVQELNRLRRESFQALTDAALSGWRRKPAGDKAAADEQSEGEQSAGELFCVGMSGADFADSQSAAGINPAGEHKTPELYAYIEDSSLLPALLRQNLIDGYYLALETVGKNVDSLLNAIRQIRVAGRKVFLAVPAVFQKRTRAFLSAIRADILAAKPDGLLVRTLDSLAFCKGNFPGIPLIADYSLYTYNRPAGEIISELGAKRRVLPIELNFRELERVSAGSCELIAYGRLPVMYSANCIRKTTAGCNRKNPDDGSRSQETIWLKDRKNKRFPVKNHCSVCFNTIYNSSPLCLLGCEEDVDRLSPAAIRLNFTTEDAGTAVELTCAYHNAFVRGEKVEWLPEDFTRGHYRRGIE